MKNVKWILMTLAILLVSPVMPLQAAEYLMKGMDGSEVFRCDTGTATHRVRVKYRGSNKYMVLRAAGGSAGFSGIVHAPNSGRAAMKGCKR